MEYSFSSNSSSGTKVYTMFTVDEKGKTLIHPQQHNYKIRWVKKAAVKFGGDTPMNT